MKDQFKQWAEAVRLCADNYCWSALVRSSAIYAANFLQSMANMQEQEPEENHRILYINAKFPSLEFVTKANRDWWSAQYFAYSIANDNLTEQLAAKDARIAELERSNAYEKFHDEAYIADLERKAQDQPPRPLLKDHPKVFNALVYAIRHADEMTSVEWLDCKEDLRKLLVGE